MYCDGIVTSTSYSWKPLPNIYMNDKNMTGSSQHGFRKRKPCLTNLTASYDETTSMVDGEKELILFNLDLLDF